VTGAIYLDARKVGLLFISLVTFLTIGIEPKLILAIKQKLLTSQMSKVLNS